MKTNVKALDEKIAFIRSTIAAISYGIGATELLVNIETKITPIRFDIPLANSKSFFKWKSFDFFMILVSYYLRI
jgi:hypothetical protein